MAKHRKTVDVSEVLAKANAFLAREDAYVTADMRMGVAIMIESILHATGNYEGYNFLGWTREGGCNRWRALNDPNADKAPFIGDETRRVYYSRREAAPRLRKGDPRDPALYPNAL